MRTALTVWYGLQAAATLAAIAAAIAQALRPQKGEPHPWK
jgi:hypothetical protein